MVRCSPDLSVIPGAATDLVGGPVGGVPGGGVAVAASVVAAGLSLVSLVLRALVLLGLGPCPAAAGPLLFALPSP